MLVLLTVVSCVFASPVEAGPQRNLLRKQLFAENERQLLLNNCNVISGMLTEVFATSGQHRGTGRENVIKAGITNYLNSVGTATARQLLREVQANGFKQFL